MTLTILASVSLLALVSSARPLPKSDEHWKGLQLSGSGEDVNVQQAIQAVVKSRASVPEELKVEDVYVQLASIEEVQAYLSSADSDAIKALIPLDQDEFHSPDQKELYELLNRLEDQRGSRSPVPDEVLDSMSLLSPSSSTEVVEPHSETSVSEGNMASSQDVLVSRPVVVMAVSCVVALIAVCCVGAVLYIAEVLQKSVFRSAWGILPGLEKASISHAGGKSGVRLTHVSREAIEGGSELVSEKMPGALSVSVTTRRGLMHVSSRNSLRGAIIETSDPGDDDVDEKFFDGESSELNYIDAMDMTPRVGPADFPPGLPALAAAAMTIAAIAVVHPPEVCEASSPELISPESGADPRPSWSVRASEASALGVRARDNIDRDEQQRRRYGMSATPGLDAALAMQLRPGLGIGADAAWLVRFVMALFGWCAVLMSGGRGR